MRDKVSCQNKDEMIAVIQSFFVILTTILFHIANTDPNPTSTSDHVTRESVFLTYSVTMGPNVAKFLIWSSSLYQLAYLWRILPLDVDLLPLTPTVLLAYILMMVGGLGRIWCYKTLGKFFTYQLTIRPSHRLIQTGPYAYVRHPSYTFAYLLIFGMLLVHGRIANFFPDSTWLQIFLGPIGIFLCCLIVTVSMRKRVIREEQELEKAFGQEWVDYASRTKRFLPGII